MTAGLINKQTQNLYEYMLPVKYQNNVLYTCSDESFQIYAFFYFLWTFEVKVDLVTLTDLIKDYITITERLNVTQTSKFTFNSIYAW